MDDIRKGACPLCRHNEILEARPGVTALGDRSARARVQPIQMTSDAGVGFIESFRRAFTGESPPRGEWRTYACRKCGYAQTFVINCALLPVDDAHGTRLILGPEPEGPYR